jgi:hypothetical protein
LLGFGYFFGKSMVLYMITLFVRFTVPRLRIDQMMNFNWKFLVPVSLVNFLAVAFVMKVFVPDYAAARSVIGSGGILGALYNVLGEGFVADLPRGIALLLTNVIILGGVGLMIQNAIRKERQTVEGSINTPSAHGDVPHVAEQALGD